MSTSVRLYGILHMPQIISEFMKDIRARLMVLDISRFNVVGDNRHLSVLIEFSAANECPLVGHAFVVALLSVAIAFNAQNQC